jgi:hypothetical protein
MKLPIFSTWQATLGRWAAELRAPKRVAYTFQGEVGGLINATNTTVPGEVIPHTTLSFDVPDGELWIGDYSCVMNISNDTLGVITSVHVSLNDDYIIYSETFTDSYTPNPLGISHQFTLQRKAYLKPGTNTFACKWWSGGGTMYSNRRIAYLTVTKALE